MNTVFEHWLHISASLSLDTESSRTFQVKTFICQEFLWHPVLFHISTKKKVSWRRAFLLQTSNIPRTVFSAWCPSVGHFPELRNRKCRASTCIGSLKICFGASSGRWTLLGILSFYRYHMLSWLLMLSPSTEPVEDMLLFEGVRIASLSTDSWAGANHGWLRISSRLGRSDGRMDKHFLIKSFTSENQNKRMLYTMQ